MTVMLRSHVTGRFNGKPVNMYINHSNLSVTVAAEAVYRELTGMTLSRRIRNWHVSHEKGKPIIMILHHAKHGNERLEINVIGRA